MCKLQAPFLSLSLSLPPPPARLLNSVHGTTSLACTYRTSTSSNANPSMGYSRLLTRCVIAAARGEGVGGGEGACCEPWVSGRVQFSGHQTWKLNEPAAHTHGHVQWVPVVTINFRICFIRLPSSLSKSSSSQFRTCPASRWAPDATWPMWRSAKQSWQNQAHTAVRPSSLGLSCGQGNFPARRPSRLGSN